MEKPKKQILYRPDKITILPENKKENIAPNVENKTPLDGKKLAEWIRTASLLNKSALCKASGLDRGNLDKYLLKGKIPLQHIQPLVLILKKYGYA